MTNITSIASYRARKAALPVTPMFSGFVIATTLCALWVVAWVEFWGGER